MSRCRSGSPAPSPTARGCAPGGQTVEAFWNSIRHAEALRGGPELCAGRRPVRRIAELQPHRRHPDLCLSQRRPAAPWASTTRRRTRTGHALHDWAEQGIVNILGGCCGTTPDHQTRGRRGAGPLAPAVPERPTAMQLAGLEQIRGGVARTKIPLPCGEGWMRVQAVSPATPRSATDTPTPNPLPQRERARTPN